MASETTKSKSRPGSFLQERYKPSPILETLPQTQTKTKSRSRPGSFLQERYKPSPILETLPQTQRKNVKDTPYELVAAIDIGTSYSSYAFSTKLDYKDSPLKICTSEFGHKPHTKVPTYILFKPDRTFDSFGFEAKEKYAELTERENHHEWFFFSNFKMALSDPKLISRSMRLSAQNSTFMRAMNVFTASIQFMKNHLLQALEARCIRVIKSNIRWVVTIPVTWSDKAKQFMRECAEKAGIPGHQLLLSLEAEAASLYCRYLSFEGDSDLSNEENVVTFWPGTRYMVVDIGGGSADVIIHEIQQEKKVKEIHMANGGCWGGNMVNREFEKFLCKIFSEEVYSLFKRKYEADYFKLLRFFELKKISLPSTEDSKITFILPSSLMAVFSEIHTTVTVEEYIASNTQYGNDMSLNLDRLEIQTNLAHTMFDASIQHISDHLKYLMKNKEVEKVDVIFLVGGYSECPLLLKQLKSEFAGKQLIVPNAAGLAALQGAVINGHEIDTISERICKLTYGVSTTYPFIKDYHPMDFFIDSNEGPLCKNIFSIYAHVGETIPSADFSAFQECAVDDKMQTELAIEIFTSTNKSPGFVSDSGCSSMGYLRVKFPDTRKGLNRGVKAYLSFGGGEIEARVYDRDTNEPLYSYLDFLV